MAPNAFHEYLKSRRQDKNLRQSEIAQLIHVSRQAYSNYEQGRCTPPVQTLAELSILLEADFFSLFLSDAKKKHQQHYK